MKLNDLFENFSSQLHKQHNDSSDEEVALSAASTKRLTEWENKKYRLLLDDSIVWKGHTLYRIQYKKDIIFNNKYYHARKDSLGGYVESLDNLSEKGSCVVDGNAKVWGKARVFDDAWVSGDAQIYDNAQVCGRTVIGGNAQAYCHAIIRNKDINSGHITNGNATS